MFNGEAMTTVITPAETPTPTPAQALIERVLVVVGKAVETEVDKHRVLLKLPDTDIPSNLRAITYQGDINYITINLLIGTKPMTFELNGKREQYTITYDDIEYRSAFHRTAIPEKDLKELFKLIFYVKSVTDTSHNYN